MKIECIVLARALAALALLTCTGATAQEHLSHGEFKDVSLHRPKGEVKSFVLLLSGDAGWNPAMATLAQTLVDEGAMVAGIDTPRLTRAVDADGGACAYPAGDLENLSRFVQGYARLPTYLTPILAGQQSGATWAYGIAAQAPEGTFAGALSQGFCPRLALNKPLCQGGGARTPPHPQARTRSIALLPVPRLAVPWVVLPGAAACETLVAQHFVAQVPGARFVAEPAAEAAATGVKAAPAGSSAAVTTPFAQAYSTLAAAPTVTALPKPPTSLADLPLVEVPAKGSGEVFAVVLSGDGGWAGLDKGLAAALSAQGIPVVGLDSLRYFWSPRTPDGLAADLGRLLPHYAAQWGKRRVVLIGYSQGADVLPFALNRLQPAVRALVEQTVLIAPGERASFEFHLGNWVGLGKGDVAILPEALRLDAATSLCLYGQDDSESICPKVPPSRMTVQALPGGHHFDGAYDRLAEIVLARLRPH